MRGSGSFLLRSFLFCFLSRFFSCSESLWPVYHSKVESHVPPTDVDLFSLSLSLLFLCNYIVQRKREKWWGKLRMTKTPMLTVFF